MSGQHTLGKLQAGVSIFQGREVFTAVSEQNTQKIVALFGFCGADDEQESIANVRRVAACWNACEGSSTEWLDFQSSAEAEDQFGKQEPFESRCSNALRRGVVFMEQRDELLAALKMMNRAYVNLLHSGRDLIVMLGGACCDAVDAMEAADPSLKASRAAIAKAEGGAA